MLKAWRRCFTLHPDGMLIVRDHIEADKPVVISWLLHALSEPTPDTDSMISQESIDSQGSIGPQGSAGSQSNSVSLDRGGTQLKIRPSSGLPGPCAISGEFGVALNEGVPEAYRVTMPPQYHLTWTTPAATVHDIKVIFTIAERVGIK
jgi:hypothetical protein